jgi:hypothetical protein
MKVHELKCDKKEFQAVYIGSKAFEVRINDRNYQVGDSLHLKEFDPEKKTFSGRFCSKRITYMLSGPSYGLPDNMVIMSII